MSALADCVRFLDTTLATQEIPDYDQALNGLQLQNNGTVSQVAVAVDFSAHTIDLSIAGGADLLVVHHGMFWGEPRPIVTTRYTRLRSAIEHNLAVYASHLPLDLHPTLGNNVRVAQALGLSPSGGFGRFKTIDVGIAGESTISTTELVDRIRRFANPLGTHVVTTPYAADRQTKKWAVMTGAGASSSTLQEALDMGVDTLIVGEGPHHTAVEAAEHGLVVIYAGHYATETLGVQAVGQALEREFALPWFFVAAPTGL